MVVDGLARSSGLVQVGQRMFPGAATQKWVLDLVDMFLPMPSIMTATPGGAARAGCFAKLRQLAKGRRSPTHAMPWESPLNIVCKGGSPSLVGLFSGVTDNQLARHDVECQLSLRVEEGGSLQPCAEAEFL
jgi:hypothetical protein